MVDDEPHQLHASTFLRIVNLGPEDTLDRACLPTIYIYIYISLKILINIKFYII